MPSFGPVIAVGNVIEVVSVCRTTDQIGLNVFHYLVSKTGGTQLLSDFTTWLHTHGFGPAMIACLSSEAEFRGILVRVVQPTPSVFFGDMIDQGDGTVAGDMLPRQVAGLISKRSAVAGRRKSGRFYMPFPGEGDNADTAVPTDDYVSRLTTVSTAIVSDLGDGTTYSAQLCIYQRPRTVGGVLMPYATRAVSFTKASEAWATQRRRGSYGRTNVSPL